MSDKLPHFRYLIIYCIPVAIVKWVKLSRSNYAIVYIINRTCVVELLYNIDGRFFRIGTLVI